MNLLSKFSLWTATDNTQTANNGHREKPLLGQRGYAVCTLPRSGSNFFCDILSSTGVLGNPREFFNGGARRMYDDPSYPDDRFAQVERILTTGATPNGVYALKIFPELHDGVAPVLRWTAELPNLSFIRFKREDVLGQSHFLGAIWPNSAVPFQRARQSGGAIRWQNHRRLHSDNLPMERSLGHVLRSYGNTSHRNYLRRTISQSNRLHPNDHKSARCRV